MNSTELQQIADRITSDLYLSYTLLAGAVKALVEDLQALEGYSEEEWVASMKIKQMISLCNAWRSCAQAYAKLEGTAGTDGGLSLDLSEMTDEEILLKIQEMS